jgi:hypothetical protein
MFRALDAAAQIEGVRARTQAQAATLRQHLEPFHTIEVVSDDTREIVDQCYSHGNRSATGP